MAVAGGGWWWQGGNGGRGVAAKMATRSKTYTHTALVQAGYERQLVASELGLPRTVRIVIVDRLLPWNCFIVQIQLQI